MSQNSGNKMQGNMNLIHTLTTEYKTIGFTLNTGNKVQGNIDIITKLWQQSARQNESHTYFDNKSTRQ